MADDGWGGGGAVHIPSILISSAQGEKLKRAVQNGEEVIVELAWDIPTSNVVAIDFWMSSGNREAMKFLSEFKEYVDAEASGTVYAALPHLRTTAELEQPLL